MRLIRLVAAVFFVFLALVAWAYVDGGREPVRPIVQPVAVPGEAG